MKTSNKILVVITIVIVGYLVVFAAGLKAEYLKGDFKTRFYQMEQLSFKNFTNVKHNVGDRVSITIEKGNTFQVWAKTFIKDEIDIKQIGQTLVINATKNNKGWNSSNSIIIICPKIDSLTITSDFEANNKPIDQYSSYNVYNLIKNFNQPKMFIKLNKLTALELEANSIDELQAIAGDEAIGKAYLDINHTNIFKVANINVPGKSELKLENPTVGKLNYTIADSAKITTFGKSLPLIK
jgi:hypothetical protein